MSDFPGRDSVLSLIQPENFTPLQRSKVTWVDRNGRRCFADLCFRHVKKLELGNPSTSIAVVSERSDNPGSSVTQSLNRIYAAVRSMFPENEEVLLFERYDERSHRRSSSKAKSHLVRVLEKPRGEPERVSLEDSEKWILNYYFNDRG